MYVDILIPLLIAFQIHSGMNVTSIDGVGRNGNLRDMISLNAH